MKYTKDNHAHIFNTHKHGVAPYTEECRLCGLRRSTVETGSTADTRRVLLEKKAPDGDITAEIDQFVYRHNRKSNNEKFGIMVEEQEELKNIVSQALHRQKEEIKKKLKIRKKRQSTHVGHSIDEYYCIQCQEGVKTHPDEIYGYNQAVDEFNKRLDSL